MPEGELASEEQQLLRLVPSSGSIGNVRLRDQLSWDTERYFRVRDSLVERGILSIGRGRGGSVSRINEDEQKLLHLVPHEGTIGNGRLRELLAWDGERYFAVRDSLVEQGVLEIGRGRGGTVSRVSSTAPPEQEPEEQVRTRREERKLYEPIAAALKSYWSRQLSEEQNVVVDVTDSGGRRSGIWTRPDITVVTMTNYIYVPGKFFDVITYEVKPAGVLSVQGVFEAASHSRFATQSYLVIHTPGGLESLPRPTVDRLEKECGRFEIGLVLLRSLNEFDAKDIRVTAERREPDPADMDSFISERLSEDSKRRIAKWGRS